MLRIILLLSTLFHFTVCELAYANELSQDSWHFHDTKKLFWNPFFWDFKYFNFHDENIVGAITYFTSAPGISQKFNVTANFFNKKTKQLYSYHQSFPLQCVIASKNSADLDVCSSGGITTTPDGHYRLSLKNGKIAWNLEVQNEMPYTAKTAFTKLDPVVLFFGHSILNWNMSWRPTFLSAKISGDVKLGDQIFKISSTQGYHDENWGIWDPAAQPFRWLHFYGADSQGSPVIALLGEFYQNKKDQAGAFAVLNQGTWTQVQHPNYHFDVMKQGMSPTMRLGIRSTEDLLISAMDSSWLTGDHAIPTQFKITSSEENQTLETKAITNTASGPEIPHWIKKLAGDFIIDEQVFAGTMILLRPDGKIETIKGYGEWMWSHNPENP